MSISSRVGDQRAGRVTRSNSRQLIENLIRWAIEKLEAARLESPRSDVQWLLAHLLSKKPTELYLHEDPVSGEIVEVFERQVTERAPGRPLHYLLGTADFCGASFIVEPGVFIPRPETEAVVAEAIRHLRTMEQELNRPLKLVDACTGSGCIAVALARALPTCTVTAIEVSWNAIFVALQNIRQHQLSTRVQVICGKWLEPLRTDSGIDGIVANPPYVPSHRIESLPLDVQQEPRMSLDGGTDGLRDVRRILRDAPRVLRTGGIIIFECGEDQVELMQAQASTWPWVARIDRIHDLAGRLRGCVIIRG